jgi:hypothetical protein
MHAVELNAPLEFRPNVTGPVGGALVAGPITVAVHVLGLPTTTAPGLQETDVVVVAGPTLTVDMAWLAGLPASPE